MKREHVRAPVSAKFLTAPPPPAETVVPKDFKITKLPARMAYGANKPKIAPRGDAPTIFQAARNTGTLARAANRRSLLTYAARSF
jgi:hypothetical protein